MCVLGERCSSAAMHAVLCQDSLDEWSSSLHEEYSLEIL